MSDPFVEGAIRRILAWRQGNLPGPCPDANELAAYLEARLTPGETDRFEKHASSCAACQATLALSLQLEERESGVSANTVLEPRRFSYRSSPIRLVLATAVVVVVGVLLFQATRQSGPPLPKPQVASTPNRSSVSGGPTAALSSPEPRTTAPPATIPAASPLSPIATEAPAQVQAERQPLRSANKPAAAAATQPAINLDALNIAKAKVFERTDLTKQGTIAEPAANAQKAERELIVANALNMKMSVSNSDETKNQVGAVGGQVAQGIQQAGQMAQQAVQGSQQASQINQQAAAPPISAAQAQAAMVQGGGGGGRGGAGGRGGGGAQQSAVAPMRVAPAQVVTVQAGSEVLQGQLSAISNYERYAMPGRIAERPALTAEMIAAAVKRLGNRVFFRTATEWVDAECGLHLGAPTRGVARNSREYRDIIAAEPALAALHASGLPILIYWHGTLCLIQ